MNNINHICYFSCLNFNNEERKIKMEKKFNLLDINCIMYKGVNFEDERIKHININHTKRVFSCMYGHLDMIYNFYHNTDKEYGVFCEDDVYINKYLPNKLHDIINDVKKMKLDILLLGYLITYKIQKNDLDKEYNYHSYSNDIWGTQMYLLTRTYAKYLLDTYYTDYANKSLIDNTLVHFSADWTITKNGNRAIVYPMLAVEDGEYKSGDFNQDKFHTDCYLANINEEFI